MRVLVNDQNSSPIRNAGRTGTFHFQSASYMNYKNSKKWRRNRKTSKIRFFKEKKLSQLIAPAYCTPFHCAFSEYKTPVTAQLTFGFTLRGIFRDIFEPGLDRLKIVHSGFPQLTIWFSEKYNMEPILSILQEKTNIPVSNFLIIHFGMPSHCMAS